ncbi:TPA_asm: hypothetical protein G1Q02_25735 [Salmonella enterica subsp. enterica serovar Typhimurium]|nr:hypothetical protein [Salmonella enterica subsp. enterica serovar Typhimurium]
MDNSGTSHAHDDFFKIVLSQPDAARDFLSLHLPPALLAICNPAPPAAGAHLVCGC